LIIRPWVILQSLRFKRTHRLKAVVFRFNKKELLGFRNYRSDKMYFYKEDFDDIKNLQGFLSEVSTGESDITKEGKSYLLELGHEQTALNLEALGGIVEDGATTQEQIQLFIHNLEPLYTRKFIESARAEQMAKGLQNTSDKCDVCPHPKDDHILLGIRNPPQKGIMFCPVEGCECSSTWSIAEEK